LTNRVGDLFVAIRRSKKKTPATDVPGVFCLTTATETRAFR
jgi:hypothetical protein